MTVHDISGDESEDETLLDEKDDEVEGGGGDTAASAGDASAALLATITEQEGLILTGGDWFKAIKNAAENDVETEKELAERMKKAKISQMSQATLENEVFEGNPPTPRPADAGPAMLQKNSKKKTGLVLDPARGGGRRVYTSSAPLSLPAGTRNPRIRSFVSGAFDRPIPAAIPPLTENEEKTVICTVFNELNEKFCVGLDNPPSFSRSIAAPPTVHSNGRTFFIGGSNLGKIAKAAAEKGSLVVDLTTSSWSPKPGNIKKVAEVLKNLNLKPCDTIVIDAMANSAYFGTDENGLPMPPAKSGEDWRHHMIGDLQLAPTAVFKTNLKQMTPF